AWALVARSAVTSPRHGPRVMLTETVAEQTPGDDPTRMHPDHLFALERLGRTAHLDPAWLPRREDVVDHQSRKTGTCRIAKLLGPGHVVATDVDRVQVGVVGPPGRHHVRHAIPADGRDPGQAPSRLAQVVELGWLEHAGHTATSREPRVMANACTSPVGER